jgi:L-rhamnose isomerase / sugar isomerase
MRVMRAEWYFDLKEKLRKESSRAGASFKSEYKISRISRDHIKSLGLKPEQVEKRLAKLELALPSWCFGAGGTRFFRFPFPGEPGDIFEKLEDAAFVNLVTGMAPRVALHYPWDKVEDPGELKRHAKKLGLGFDAVNVNLFQDLPDQKLSYKFGSLSNADPAVRKQAVDLCRETIEFGKQTGSKDIIVWLADGSNHPGQMHLRKSFDHYLESLRKIYKNLPPAWTMFLEYKPFEPAFYYTVNFDWGCSYAAALALGENAMVLVDLGHHLPGANVEAVVARLIQLGKLGGFHFNDSKYGDDDLTAGSISPYKLFLIMNEIVDAENELFGGKPFLSFMIDQSHNVKDPIEEMLQTCEELASAYCKALLVNREALAEAQANGDPVTAEKILKAAFFAPVSGLLARLRLEKGGAADPVGFFRKIKYRGQLARRRKKEV